MTAIDASAAAEVRAGNATPVVELRNVSKTYYKPDGSVMVEALRSTDLPPTIRTKQGAGVRIFVARDLDFSAVGPAR